MRRAIQSLIIRRRSQRRRMPANRCRVAARRTGLGLSLGLGLAAAVLALGITWAAVRLTSDLPSLDLVPAMLDPQEGLLLESTRVYDRSGTVALASLENPGLERHFLRLDPTQSQSFDPRLVQVTLSLQEPRFWNSPGFSARHLLVPEPRTLAERLAVDLLLPGEPPSTSRALRMRILAAQLTANFGRAQVLEWYLNSAAYGHLAFGADNAARLYLGKTATSLTLAESALLVTVSQAPALNPMDAPEAARERSRLALEQLLMMGIISTGDFTAAVQEELAFVPAPEAAPGMAQAFTRLVLEQLSPDLGRQQLERGGLRIITTLDARLQQESACALQVQLQRLAGVEEAATLADGSPCEAARLLPTLPPGQPAYPAQLNGSLAILDVAGGEVLALLGDTAFGTETSVVSARPPGSLLSPFVALAAFQRGYSPASMLLDVPGVLPSGLENYSDVETIYHGPLRLRTALANDYLAPISALLNEMTPGVAWGLAERFGLQGFDAGADPLSLLYEGGRLDVLDASQAYRVFANGGQYSELRLVSVVTDTSGRTLWEPKSAPAEALVSPQLAYLVHHVLADELARRPSLGYPNPLDLGRPAAGRVGQTADGSQVWTIGYSPSYLAVTWLGYPYSAPDAPAPETRQAAGIWHAAMQYLHRGRTAEGFPLPAGIETVKVCDPSGLLPTQACPLVVDELFLAGNEPLESDTLYQRLRINRESGLLATVFTPPESVEERTYMVLPAQAREWAEEADIPQPPEGYDTIQPPPSLADVRITSPAWFSFVSGEVRIEGTAAGAGFESFRVQAGQGLDPRAWVQVGEDSSRPVRDGLLAAWDTRGLDGLYALMLIVEREGQQVETDVIQVTVDNTPPAARIVYPRDGQELVITPGREMVFQCEVEDGSGIAAVTWLLDGRSVLESRQAPYSLVWQPKPGQYTLELRAADLAGNISEAERVRFEVVP